MIRPLALRLAASVLVLAVVACGKPAAPTVSEPAAPPAAAVPAVVSLSPKGLGPILIGMTDADVRAAAGAANVAPSEGPDASEGCSQVRLQGQYPGAILMLEDGKLTRITLGEGSTLKTDHGIGVGATPAQVMAAYPGATSGPHKYEAPPAAYITAWTDPAKEGTVFEISGTGTVAAIHAGGPSIQYVEGCA